ncbi:MAG: MvdC family ATP-grasp ribosomal peptide maturase [Deltaproteobacteria bacterium]|nr:MvdC family ATP-grasp ribosomal peptide maturase [Deltaproteobacteria bacterium]
MTVLLLTCRDDFYVPELVVDAVRALGLPVLRVDSDLFPGVHALSIDDAGRWHLEAAGVVVDDVTAVWCRRRWPGAGLTVDERWRAGCVAQGQRLMGAWLRALGGRVVNDVDAEDAAEDKVLQLRVARGLGFQIPETLISNDPARVRAFVDVVRRGGGRVITKLLAPLLSSMQAADGFFYTANVDDDDLSHVADVIHAPQIFQRAIDKTLELRVQVVGATEQEAQVFCGALPATVQDWRLQQGARWQHHTLSTTTTARCRALIQSLGLVTGAIDLLVDGEGREWFLEVNPAGEWGFLQAELGLPIAEALARVLSARAC